MMCFSNGKPGVHRKKFFMLLRPHRHGNLPMKSFFEKEMAGAPAMHFKARLCKAGCHSITCAIIPSLNSVQFENL
jgi:hypothetical protein